MAFEPFGWGSRWQDRLGGRVLKLKEFAIVLLIIGTAIVVWQLI